MVKTFELPSPRRHHCSQTNPGADATMRDGPNDMSVVCVLEQFNEKWLKCDGHMKITGSLWERRWSFHLLDAGHCSQTNPGADATV